MMRLLLTGPGYCASQSCKINPQLPGEAVLTGLVGTAKSCLRSLVHFSSVVLCFSSCCSIQIAVRMVFKESMNHHELHGTEKGNNYKVIKYRNISLGKKKSQISNQASLTFLYHRLEKKNVIVCVLFFLYYRPSRALRLLVFLARNLMNQYQDASIGKDLKALL